MSRQLENDGWIHAVTDRARERVWAARFQEWAAQHLEPRWQADAREQYDGWSDDLPELEMVRILVQLRRMCAP